MCRKFLVVLTILHLFIFGITLSFPVSAHHEATHRAIVLGEKSTVLFRIFICKKKEDADSVLIAYEQGGYSSGRARAFFLRALVDEDGRWRCKIASSRITPIFLHRSINATVKRSGVFIKTKLNLIAVLVHVYSDFKPYFSPITVPVVDGVSI